MNKLTTYGLLEIKDNRILYKIYNGELKRYRTVEIIKIPSDIEFRNENLTPYLNQVMSNKELNKKIKKIKKKYIML